MMDTEFFGTIPWIGIPHGLKGRAAADRPVLVPNDGSPTTLRALDHVLARRARGDALLPYLLAVVPHAEGVEENLEALGRAATSEARARLGAAGVPYVLGVAAGPPAVAIARIAKELACEEIVMGTRGLRAIEGILLGSVTQRVLHLSEVPVTLVR
jgi:nucleotide-binding universal stress UspA family protein